MTLPIVNCQLLIVHCLVDLFGYFLDAVCSSYRVEVEAWDAMGIKPFKKLSQLSMIPKTFKVDLLL